MSNKRDTCEIILRARGTSAHPALVVEIQSAYKAEFYAALKGIVPYGAWRYDEARRTWFVAEQFRAQVEQLALAHFARVYRMEGDRMTDVRSNTPLPTQPGMF